MVSKITAFFVLLLLARLQRQGYSDCGMKTRVTQMTVTQMTQPLPI